MHIAFQMGFLMGEDFLDPIRDTGRLETLERIRREAEGYLSDVSGAPTTAVGARTDAASASTSGCGSLPIVICCVSSVAI